MRFNFALIGPWAEAAATSRDAADLLTNQALCLCYEAEPNGEAIRKLIRAARFAGIQHSVFTDLMLTEVRIAKKVG